jgi:ADP-ribose pyrophosphatase YjhB (NUDIX family)
MINKTGIILFSSKDTSNVLIIERKETSKYSFPIGNLENKETVINGALRELKEKTNINKNQIEILQIETPLTRSMGNYFEFYYICVLISEDVEIKFDSLNSKNIVNWISTDEILKSERKKNINKNLLKKAIKLMNKDPIFLKIEDYYKLLEEKLKNNII